MPSDDFNISVTQNVDTDLANGRPWQIGPVAIKEIAVYAPAAATNAEWSLFADDQEVIPRGTQPVGTTPSATPEAERKKADIIADRQNRVIARHAGAAAQTFRVQVEYETPTTDEEVSGEFE